MLRKILTLGALVVVAVAFGAGPASAANCHKGGTGFSDGRLGN